MFEKEDSGRIYFIEKGRKVPTKIISALITIKYLRKGCEAYLASVIDKGNKGVLWENMPVVNEFEDRFPEDLLGLPPEREIKFEIELLLGIILISQPLYRMTPVELKELKVQLQKLLDKEFI